MKKNTWHLATAGQLSRNKFWGEDENVFYHPVLATSTVIQSESGNILVDPSLEASKMGDAVFNCCGVKPDDINYIYITHMHNDHWMGLEAFPKAKVFMAEKDAGAVKEVMEYMDEKTRENASRIVPASGELLPGFTLIPLPGHTLGVQGLLFEGPGGKTLATGDSVMNAEFFSAREGYFFSADSEKSKESIAKAAAMADFIIPGHGNYFMTKAYPFEIKGINTAKPAENPDEEKWNITIGEIIKDEKGKAVLLEAFPNFPLLSLIMTKDFPLSVILKSAGPEAERVKELLSSKLGIK
jgi:glyoxylase-like metal-dependent hydrolase (beta-lactamase superfamily II)